jgi:uncharacterized membrane protein YqjE
MPESRSLSEIVQDILADIQNIIRAEIRLARTELNEKAQKIKLAAGFFGVAAIFGLMGAFCFLAACVAALALVMPFWLSALLIAIALFAMAAGAYIAARNRFAKVDAVPHQTVETVKEDIEWAKQRTR